MTISRVERMSVSRNRHTNVCNNTTTKLQMNKKIVSKPGRTQGLFQRGELHDFSKSRKIAASNLPHSVKWGVIVSMDKYSFHAVFPFFSFVLDGKYSQE